MTKYFKFILLPFLALVMMSCGPMNSEKKVSGGGNSPQQSLKGVNSSQNNLFYVHIAAAKEITAGDVGEDSVYFLHSVLSKDLSYLSPQAKISVQYLMPDMPAMGTTSAVANRLADGSYSFTLVYSMTGRWQIIVTIQDGNVKDDYIFEALL